jgi:hypothetical protein
MHEEPRSLVVESLDGAERQLSRRQTRSGIGLGASENAAVIKALLSDLIERGALSRAVRDTFGGFALIQPRIRSLKAWMKCSP